MEECVAIIMKSYRNLKEKRKGLQELLQEFDLEGYCEWKRIWNQQFGEDFDKKCLWEPIRKDEQAYNYLKNINDLEEDIYGKLRYQIWREDVQNIIRVIDWVYAEMNNSDGYYFQVYLSYTCEKVYLVSLEEAWNYAKYHLQRFDEEGAGENYAEIEKIPLGKEDIDSVIRWQIDKSGEVYFYYPDCRRIYSNLKIAFEDRRIEKMWDPYVDFPQLELDIKCGDRIEIVGAPFGENYRGIILDLTGENTAINIRHRNRMFAFCEIDNDSRQRCLYHAFNSNNWRRVKVL